MGFTRGLVDENIYLKCPLYTKDFLLLINESGSTGLPVRNTCPKELNYIYRAQCDKATAKAGSWRRAQSGASAATKEVREGAS